MEKKLLDLYKQMKEEDKNITEIYLAITELKEKFV